MNKIYYLYYRNKNNNICDISDVYCFKNNIVAIDKFKYDKKDRYEFQNKYDISPYYVTQRSLMEFIIFASEYPQKINIINIEFIDSIDDIDEEDLSDIIIKNNYDSLITKIKYIINEYDTELYSIKIQYEEHVFTIITDGVIVADEVSEKVWSNFIRDNITEKLLLGQLV